MKQRTIHHSRSPLDNNGLLLFLSITACDVNNTSFSLFNLYITDPARSVQASLTLTPVLFYKQALVYHIGQHNSESPRLDNVQKMSFSGDLMQTDRQNEPHQLIFPHLLEAKGFNKFYGLTVRKLITNSYQSLSKKILY